MRIYYHPLVRSCSVRLVMHCRIIVLYNLYHSHAVAGICIAVPYAGKVGSFQINYEQQHWCTFHLECKLEFFDAVKFWDYYR